VADGSLRLELIEEPQAVQAALVNAGAAVALDGRVLQVSSEHGDVFTIVRDAVASTGASIRRLDAAGGSLEDLFLHHGSGT